MEFSLMLLIAVGLAMDAFAVSLGIGTNGAAASLRSIFRVSFHMGFFQGLMTFLGWLAGSTVADLIAAYDHWIAMGLLAVVGINMIQSGFSRGSDTPQNDPSRGSTLMMVCIATSIDAMAVGLSLAMLKINILPPTLVVGFVTLGLSIFGLLAGKSLGYRFGKRMEVLGGLILNGIGLRILLTHLL